MRQARGWGCEQGRLLVLLHSIAGLHLQQRDSYPKQNRPTEAIDRKTVERIEGGDGRRAMSTMREREIIEAEIAESQADKNGNDTVALLQLEVLLDMRGLLDDIYCVLDGPALC